MPELPDVEVYREALERFVVGHPVTAVRVLDLFLVLGVVLRSENHTISVRAPLPG